MIIDMSEANQRNAHFYPPSHFPPFERYLASPTLASGSLSPTVPALRPQRNVNG